MKKDHHVNRHVREGWNNFKRNGWMTAASVSSLAFMLFLIGMTLMLSLNMNSMAVKVEENVEIRVYLEDTESTEVEKLSETIKAYDRVASVEFISKAEGLQRFMENLGDEGAAFETLKEDNPLNDVLVVRTEQPQDVKTVAEQVERLEFVDKVEYAESVVGALFQSTKLARIIGTLFIICLILIAVHLVTNTIRITVLARKEEIQLRKLIGATNGFIRIPFFIEGSLIGFLGAAIASILTVIMYYTVYRSIMGSIDIAFIQLLSPMPLIPLSCLFLFLIGILIGIAGAQSSLRRMLKI